MTDFNEFALHAEADLRTERKISEPTWQLLPDESRLTFLPIVRFLGRAEDATQICNKVSEKDRITACRLMLLKLSVDTEDPRWSSMVLSRLVNAALQLSDGSVGDIFYALCSIFDDYPCKLTQTVANLIKSIVIECFTHHSTSYQGADWSRFVQRLTPMITESQCYFAFHAIPPQLIPATMTKTIETKLASTPFRDEIVAAMAG